MKYIFQLILFFFWLPVIGQEISLVPGFRKLSDFPANGAYCMLEDSRGFIWFGTNKGLIRYDGVKYQSYYPDPADSTKLYEGNIHYLLEDYFGRIWLSAGGGVGADNTIQVFDTNIETFTTLAVRPVSNHGYFWQTHFEAQNYFLKDIDSSIWIKSYTDGIYRVDGGNLDFVHHYSIEQSTGVQGADSSTVLFIDSRDQIWVGTKAGLFRFIRENDIFRPFPSKNEILSDQVNGIAEDQKGLLWINYSHSGLVHADTETGDMSVKWDKGNAQAIWNYVQGYILKDYQENLWMTHQELEPAHLGDGLSHYKPKSDEKFQYFQVLPNDAETWVETKYQLDRQGKIWTIYSNVNHSDRGIYVFDYTTNSFKLFAPFKKVLNATKLYFDSFQNLWLTTLDHGVYLYHESNNKFSSILAQLPIHGIMEDRLGRVWLGAEASDELEGGGLYRITYSPNQQIKNVDLILDYVICWEPLQDREGNIWVTCANNDLKPPILHRIEYETEKITTFQHDPNDPATISTQPFFPTELKNGKFLIAGYFGLSLFDPQTGISKNFSGNSDGFPLPSGQADTVKLLGDIWNNVMIDDLEQVWVFNQIAINLFDPEAESFTVIDSTASKRFGNINDMLQDRNGAYWISGGYGLFNYDPETNNIVRHYTIEDGLPTIDLKRIIEDQNGNFWIGTDNGLVLFERRKERFVNYFTTDGLTSNDFSQRGMSSRGPGLETRAGRLFFGTKFGLVSFDPNSFPQNQQFPKVVITDLKLHNQSVNTGTSILPQSITATEQLYLGYHQNLISFEFAALSFTNPSKNQYAYYLDGLESDWNYVGNQTFASYAGLQPGDYTFNLKASNNDGLWNETPTQLKITILPPWWETWWAYTLYAILFLGSVLGIYRFQINRKLEQAETKRLREMDEFKTRFYTNITHEFRTPLTVILGVADQIELKYQKVKNLIKRNALNVLQLVNQLLDLSKLESGMLRLNLQQGDVGKFIKYVAESFHSLAEIKQIDIHFRSEVPELIMDFDPDKMMNILSNLLSNAIKFTPDTGHISIVLSKQPASGTTAGRQQERQETMILRVSDTGVGIAEDQLENIFDRFYQVDASTTRAASGTGIGLALTRELVRLMGGQISVKSTLYQGTEFTVELPITNEAEMMDRITPQEIVEAPIEKEDEVLPTSNGHSGRPVALIVEDSIDVVYYLRTCLQNDYSLRIANNGQEGIEKALEATPDIIISDVMMPEKNGYELTDALKNDVKTSHIPIILLTAKATEEDKLEGLGAGADAYLTKPFNVDELKLRIRNLIRERKKLWQRYNQELSYQPQQLDVSSPDQKFLSQALAVLEEHKSDSEFNSAKLQQELGVSRTLLHVKLKALTGQSTTEFIRTYRLKYAATLILQEFGNIAEIAYESGFNDQSYFTKSFRKHFGVAPSEYKGGVI